MLFLTGLLWSCEMAEIIEPVPELEPEIVADLPDSVYFILSAPNPHTRVVYADEFRSEFEREDIVGCFALDENYAQVTGGRYKANARYRVAVHSDLETHEDRHFLSPLTESDNIPRDCAHYLFYYPYDPDVKTLDDLKEYGHAVLEDQNQREKYEASDLLWDVCEPKNGKYVEVKMDHAMANVIVEVLPELIEEGDVPTLLGMPTTSAGIDLTTTALEDLSYETSSPHAIRMWEFGKAVSGNLMFRAVVPACHSIASGTDVVQIPDPDGDGLHTYSCQKSFDIKPGKNYHFTVTIHPESSKDDVDITPPEIVDDDDTWVYDVVDPDTMEPLGLLCKEYLHFQPGHSASDKDLPTGTPYDNGIDAPSKYISSQAWVLYKYKSGGLPDLNTGFVLRFIKDVRSSEETEITSLWPQPHEAYFNGGGLFTPDHGYLWVAANGLADWAGNYGTVAVDGETYTIGYQQVQVTHSEHYMHGGVVTWNGSTNKIEWFTLPTEQVTNEQAKNVHIAIDEGNLRLCYNSISDDPPHKIAALVPHNLIDRRVSKNRTVDERVYPLVKIGYNHFWMSLSLRASTMVDGTPLANYNKVGEPGISIPAADGDVGPAYIFTYKKLEKTETIDGVERTYYDPYNDYTREQREEYLISPMYNFQTLSNSGMLPKSSYPAAEYYMPTVKDLQAMKEYLGNKFGAKVITNGQRIRQKGGGFIEDEYPALREGKYTTTGMNIYAANICGFDLRAEGFFRNDMQNGEAVFTNVGDDARILVLGTGDPGDSKEFIFALPHYMVFTDDFHVSASDANIFVNTYAQSPSVRLRSFAPIRFFLKFAGQDDTGGISVSSLSASSLVKMKAPSSAQVENRDIYIGLDPSTKPRL